MRVRTGALRARLEKQICQVRDKISDVELSAKNKLKAVDADDMEGHKCQGNGKDEVRCERSVL